MVITELANSGTTILAYDPEKIREMVATVPTQKRAALSKALNAACRHLRDSKQNYSQAFELASAMVENWWHLGRELRKIEKHQGNALPQGSTPGVRLSEIGINHNQSSRCQKLAEWEREELDEWLQGVYDEQKYSLPTLKPAATRASGGGAVVDEWHVSDALEDLNGIIRRLIDRWPPEHRPTLGQQLGNYARLIVEKGDIA